MLYGADFLFKLMGHGTKSFHTDSKQPYENALPEQECKKCKRLRGTDLLFAARLVLKSCTPDPQEAITALNLAQPVLQADNTAVLYFKRKERETFIRFLFFAPTVFVAGFFLSQSEKCIRQEEVLSLYFGFPNTHESTPKLQQKLQRR